VRVCCKLQHTESLNTAVVMTVRRVCSAVCDGICFTNTMGNVTMNDATTNDASTNEYYKEQFLSIKSGCYNEHRFYNERGSRTNYVRSSIPNCICLNFLRPHTFPSGAKSAVSTAIISCVCVCVWVCVCACAPAQVPVNQKYLQSFETWGWRRSVWRTDRLRNDDALNTASGSKGNP